MRHHNKLIRLSAGFSLLAVWGMMFGRMGSPFLLLPLGLPPLWRLIFPSREILHIKKRKIYEIGGGLFLIAYLVGRLYSSGGEVLTSCVETLLIFQALKWLSFLDWRDLLVLSGLSYVEIITIASVTSNFYFLPLFVGITVLTTLLLFFNFVSSEQTEGGYGLVAEIPISGRMVTFIGSFGILSLLVTIFIFLAFPRMGAGYFGKRPYLREKLPGTEGTITLKEKTFSNEGENVVARLKGLPAEDSPFYIKSITLTRYEDDTWYREGGKSILRHFGDYYPLNGKVRSAKARDVELFMEPTGGKNLFTLPGTVAVSWRGEKLSRVGDGDLSLENPLNYPVKYTLYVKEGDRQIHDGYGYSSLEGIPGYILRIAGDLRGKAENEAGMIRKISSYLRSRMKYKRSPGPVSLEEFLVGRKKGNCQHFATGTVLMARAMGFPSRIAGGYVSNEFNEVGNYWMFRGKDAHAWAEVFLRDKGWVNVDSTPAGGALPGMAKGFSHYLDYLHQKWQEYIVGYSMEKQVKLSLAIIDGSWRFTHKFRTKIARNLSVQSITPLVATIFFLVLTVLWTRRKKRNPGQRNNLIYVQYLKPVLDAGRKSGIPREKSETVWEYCERLKGVHRADRETATLFGELYCRARFGNLLEHQESLLWEASRNLVKLIKDGKREPA